MIELGELRVKLDQMTERIVSRFKDRSRFPLNEVVYKPDGVSVVGRSGISLLQFAVEGLETYHASLGRYDYPDQYPYILLARDIARRKGFIPPAAIFTKFTHGLDGQGKMSSSRPASTVSLTDEPQTARNRIRGAYTGGSVLASFQKEHGGVPGVCPIYYLRTYHFEEDNRVWDQCSNGEILCGQCKGAATEDIVNFLEDHQQKLTEARQRISEFILNTPIKSILE